MTPRLISKWHTGHDVDPEVVRIIVEPPGEAPVVLSCGERREL
jgi:hypothetical protein